MTKQEWRKARGEFLTRDMLLAEDALHRAEKRARDAMARLVRHRNQP